MSNEQAAPIEIGAKTGIEVNCHQCDVVGTTDSLLTLSDKDGNDTYLCNNCREKINSELNTEPTSINLLLGLIGGSIGGALGGLIWYLVAILFKVEVGYVAIGLGILAGYGVHLGAGRKYGYKLQILSAFITLSTIYLSEYFIFTHFANEYIQNNLDVFTAVKAGEMISFSIVDMTFLQSLVSPMGLLIYAIGIYCAYKTCRTRTI